MNPLSPSEWETITQTDQRLTPELAAILEGYLLELEQGAAPDPERLIARHPDLEDELRSFLPERWHRNQLEQELDHALNSLIEAEACFEKGLRRLASSQPAGVANLEGGATPAARRNADPASADDSRAWLRRGFAFTLPLSITLILGLILAKILF